VMKDMLQLEDDYHPNYVSRIIGAEFGFSAPTVARTWNELECVGALPLRGKVHHLLWMLAYFKTYAPYIVYSIRWKTTTNTLSKWIWQFALAIASMEHIVSTESLF
jgi:hypothetical protein